jgi:hypothetical protein
VKITASLKKTVTDAAWQQVVAALAEGMHNISYGESAEGGSLDDFLREHSLVRGVVVFVATHSIGGRSWAPSGDKDVAFYPDIIGGGWNVLDEDDASTIKLVSATSGSSLTAERQFNGMWTVTLEVPVQEGSAPYEGYYWTCFHNVFYQALVL